MILDQHGHTIGAIDAAEDKVSAVVQNANNVMARHREILHADEIASMTNVRPRFEKEFNLRAIAGEKNKLFMFSIDGTLNGRAIVGALFAGECIVVTQPTFDQAFRMAKDGLQETIHLLHEEFADRIGKESSAIHAGLQHEAAGRRGHGSPDGQELRRDPRLKAMLAHIIGGLPWKM